MNASAKPKQRSRLSRQDWINAARETLIEAGVSAIKVDKLANQLQATRGSFYWHFTDHADLMQALLAEWREETNRPFLKVLDDNRDQPLVQIIRYFEVWLSGQDFDPQHDAAMRDWARISPPVEDAVRHVEEGRIDVLIDIFVRLGYSRQEAIVRGRTVYYHQVGYFTLKVAQTRAERLELFPIYFQVLTGCPLPPDRLASGAVDTSSS